MFCRLESDVELSNGLRLGDMEGEDDVEGVDVTSCLDLEGEAVARDVTGSCGNPVGGGKAKYFGSGTGPKLLLSIWWIPARLLLYEATFPMKERISSK